MGYLICTWSYPNFTLLLMAHLSRVLGWPEETDETQEEQKRSPLGWEMASDPSSINLGHTQAFPVTGPASYTTHSDQVAKPRTLYLNPLCG